LMKLGAAMGRWAELVLRHRKAVAIIWGVVLVAGIALASKTTSRLTVDFSLPGQPGTETAHLIKQTFGSGGDTSPYIATVTPRAAGRDNNSGPGVLGETMIGAVGALAVLAFVFASFLALLPLVIAAVSILTSFLLLLPLTYVMDVSFIVQFLVALIGLGVAID